MTTSTHYRSLTTGEVIAREELIDCERCTATGEVPIHRRDSITGHELLDRMVPCQRCGGTGYLEGFGIHGDNYAPRRVVAVGDPLMEESPS